MQRFRSIQVLRAVAARAVAYLHCSQVIGAPTGSEGYGALGVDLFFVISGFIMAQVSPGRSAREFVRDRLWRIYPLWWIALLPWLILLPRGPAPVITSLTLWPILNGSHYVPILQVGWTLSFELLFYLGMAAALASSSWLPLAVYAGLVTGALFTPDPLLRFLGNPIAVEFLLGVLIARLPRRAAFGSLAFLALALISFTSPTVGSARSVLLDTQASALRVLEWGLPAAMIVWAALSLEPWFEGRIFDLPVAAGDASYSIYLIHPLVAYGLALAWPLKLISAIGMGFALHQLIERRIILAFRRRRLSPRPQLAAA